MRSNVPLRYRLPHHHADDWPDHIEVPAHTIRFALDKIASGGRIGDCRFYGKPNFTTADDYPAVYWMVKRRRFRLRVSRLVLMLSLDRPIPPGTLALHSCNCARCVNVDHIREGSHADNMQDRMKLVADLRAGRVVPFASPRDRAATFHRPRLIAA